MIGDVDDVVFDDFKAVDDIDDRFRRVEDIADVLEKEVAHKAAPDDFFGVNFARNGQDFFSVERDHFPVVVFAVNGEEVQHFANVPFPRVAVAFAGGRVRA